MTDPNQLVFRVVHANAPHENAKSDFANNIVITSRYTVINFIPKFLFEQFTRFVNLYFLYVHACCPRLCQSGLCPCGRVSARVGVSVLVPVRGCERVIVCMCCVAEDTGSSSSCSAFRRFR